MTKRYMTPTEASRAYKVTPTAISSQMKLPKGKLSAAVVTIDGKVRIDMEHADAKAWVPAGRNTRAEPDEAAAKQIGTVGGVGLELEKEIRKYWDYTLKDIIEKYGTMQLFAALLQAASKVEAIHAQRLTADRSTGELISRDYVRKHVLGLVEQVFQRMLTEMPVTLASKVHTMCATDGTLEEVEQEIRVSVSRELKTIKKDTAKEIKRAKD